MPEGDIGWALEIDPEDLQACGGFLPKRAVKKGGGEVDEAARVLALEGGVSADGLAGGGGFGADAVESGAEEGAAEAAVVSAGLAEGGTWNVPATKSVSSEDGGLDNDVTNEANSPDEAVKCNSLAI